MKKVFKSKLFLIPLIILGTICLSVVTIGISYALFTRTNIFTGMVNSDNFYFESNYLSEENPTYELNAGTTSITFDVRNYEDILRFSSTDIKVSISSDKGTLSKTETNLTGNSVSSDVITLSGLSDGESYTVTVVGDAGFKKTLTATFKVRTNDVEIYKHTDTSNPAYVLLTVWTKAESGTFSVEYEDAFLVADNTWMGMESITNDFVQSISENSSITYRFFITGSTDLAKLKVYFEGNEVTEKTPS